MDNTADRAAAIRAAEAFDKIERKIGELQRALDEGNAKLTAQETLVHQLQLMLSEERNNSAAYRADAEQARADMAAMLTLFATVKDMFNGFAIPSEKLPMRKSVPLLPSKEEIDRDIEEAVASGELREIAASISGNRGKSTAN